MWGREDEKELERCEAIKLKEADTHLHTTHIHRVLSAKNACNKKKLKDRDIFSLIHRLINIVSAKDDVRSGCRLVVISLTKVGVLWVQTATHHRDCSFVIQDQ